MKKVLISLMMIWAGSASAASGVDIVAVVNDKAISNLDLQERVAIVMATTGIPDSPENRSRLVPQILKQLVDERLQQEDGERNGITISDARVKEGIAQIEGQSGKPEGSLEVFLRSRGLSLPTFYAQVRAQMTWADIVMKKIRPRIRISDEEVSRYVARRVAPPASRQAPRIAANQPLGKEVKIALIQLPVDSPQNEPKVKKIADKLAQEIHAGAKFEAVASQFSSSTGTTHIMEPFWMETAQLDPQVVAALTTLAKEGVSQPVRTAEGYQIIKLVDQRKIPPAPAPKEPKKAEPVDTSTEPSAELAYKQILMTLKPDAEDKEAELLLKLAREVAKAPGKCEEASMAGEGDLAELEFKVSFTRANSDEMPEKLRDLLMTMKVGGVSQPIVTPEGIRLFMLCERTDLAVEKGNTPRNVATGNATRQAIYAQKLELEAQKYMRDLRRSAFIEIRQP